MDAMTPTPMQIAVEELERTNDVQMATRATVRRLEGEIYKQWRDELLREAAYSLVTHACRASRQALWMPREVTAAETRRRLEARADVSDSLLMFRLPSGLPLGLAHTADVMSAAEFYLVQAKDMQHKGKWLALVADRVPAGKVVRDVLSEAQLRTLQKRAAPTERGSRRRKGGGGGEPRQPGREARP